MERYPADHNLLVKTALWMARAVLKVFAYQGASTGLPSQANQFVEDQRWLADYQQQLRGLDS